MAYFLDHSDNSADMCVYTIDTLNFPNILMKLFLIKQ